MRIEFSFVPDPTAYYPTKVSEVIEYRFQELHNAIFKKGLKQRPTQ